MSYKRVIITKFGEPEVLQVIEETMLPEPQAGEVRIKVLATSAAFTDTMIRRGVYPDVKDKPPFSPGYDMVGIIDKLGEGVTQFKVGQKVAELTVIGAYTEYICLREECLVPVPEELDPAEAVSMILSYLTAYQMLHRKANVQRGQRILIHGAGGAVGVAMLQLGKLYDLEMYGTGSKSKHELITSLGGIPIDYKTEDFVERIRHFTDDGVDAVFDGVGGKNFIRSFKSLRAGGKLVIFGAIGIDPESLIQKLGLLFYVAQLFLMNIFSRTRTLAGLYSIAPLRKKQPDWFYEDLTGLFRLVGEGKIKPVIDKRMPLAEAAKAHELVEQAKVKGKIVLVLEE